MIMSERTDAAILLRFVYQAMRNANLPAEQVLMGAGVGLNHLDANARTPSAAQLAFWQSAEKVSQDPQIGLHLGEHLPLYRGQVLEYLFLSSSKMNVIWLICSMMPPFIILPNVLWWRYYAFFVLCLKANFNH